MSLPKLLKVIRFGLDKAHATVAVYRRLEQSK